MTTLEKIRAEIADLDDAEYEFEGYYKAVNDVIQIIDKYTEQEPCDKCAMKNSNSNYCKNCMVAEYNGKKVSVPTKFVEQEPCDDEITLKVKRGALKSRQGDMVIYNVAWLREHWQMEMDIVCGVKPCDDAISREDALNSLIENTDFEGWELSQVLKAIEDLPSVRPQERTGKWKFVCQHWRKCSECGFSHKFAEDWNYCPNCGAKMVEQRESEVRNETK